MYHRASNIKIFKKKEYFFFFCLLLGTQNIMAQNTAQSVVLEGAQTTPPNIATTSTAESIEPGIAQPMAQPAGGASITATLSQLTNCVPKENQPCAATVNTQIEFANYLRQCAQLSGWQISYIVSPLTYTIIGGAANYGCLINVTDNTDPANPKSINCTLTPQQIPVTAEGDIISAIQKPILDCITANTPANPTDTQAPTTNTSSPTPASNTVAPSSPTEVPATPVMNEPTVSN